MKKGFTLVELIAVITVLGIISLITVPIIEKSLRNSKETTYNAQIGKIIQAAKDWTYEGSNTMNLPDENNGTYDIKLSTLKKEGFIQVNVENPKTERLFSDESYVTIKRVITDTEDGTYVYEPHMYDIPDTNEADAPIIALNGNYRVNINVGDAYTENGATSDVSIQITLNGKQVMEIDNSRANTYEIKYTKLLNDKVGLAIRTVIVK